MNRKTLNQRGFTLVEILVVAPIYVLVAMLMLGLLIDRYGDTLLKSEEANLILEAQSVLRSMEDNIFFADGFGEGLEANLTDANEPSGGWDWNTTPITLIIDEVALDAHISEPNRDIVYRNDLGCTTGVIEDNELAINNIIYYTEDNVGDDYMTLYKRTVAADSSETCTAPFRRTSCPEASATAMCPPDGALSRRVVDFSVDYYDDNDTQVDLSSGGTPVEGVRAEVSLTIAGVANGEEIQITQSRNYKRIN